MKVIKGILIAIVIILVLAVGVGFLLPKSVHMERSIVIDAPQCTVFALVNSFKGFNRWSPWAERDPNAQYTYEGAVQGVGAKMSWTSENPKVGSGSQEITSSMPCDRLVSHLDFGAQGEADAYFQLQESDTGTKVTWGFDTEFGMNLIGRYFGLFMDSMLGPDYEQGLANLKALAENLPKTDISGLQPEPVDVESQPIVYVSTSALKDDEAIEKAIGQGFGRVFAFIAQNNLAQAGDPMTIATSAGEDGFEFDIAVPLEAAPESVDPESGVKLGQSYTGQALRFVHRGAYRELPQVHERIAAYMDIYAYELAGQPWEQYPNDPNSVEESEQVTHIFYPIN